MNLPENATEEEYQAWLADPDTPPLAELQWAHQVVDFDLPFCGCGRPETVWDMVRDLLALIERRAPLEDYWAVLPLDAEGELHPAGEMILNVLDDADLTEHGGSVYGSWLTDKGARFLAVARKVGYEDLQFVGYPHDTPAPGPFELVEYGGAWMIRRISDKGLVWQGQDEIVAKVKLGQMNQAGAEL